MTVFEDCNGVRVSTGDNVRPRGRDASVPLWAIRGKVVGFGRTRIRIAWEGTGGYRGPQEFHAVPTWQRRDARRADSIQVVPALSREAAAAMIAALKAPACEADTRPDGACIVHDVIHGAV